MISCTEFIPAYSELFKFLEKKGGARAVLDFWNFFADAYLTTLKNLAAERGVRGCWKYWSKTLNEEAADFTMELDEEAGELTITIHHCPSKGRLLELKHLKAYGSYCRHCDILYRRVLEPLGLEYRIDLSRADQARCRVTVKAKPVKA